MECAHHNRPMGGEAGGLYEWVVHGSNALFQMGARWISVSETRIRQGRTAVRPCRNLI
jgi:hypothetical protein